jgi:predicted unusual protein kinase regulating ubiquinone biosynthesis (AarF/ABC1/UbiB family)
MPDDKKKDPIPTGWLQRGAKLAGQTAKSAARFTGTRVRSFADPSRAGEFVDSFHQQTAKQLVDMLGEMKGAAMKVGQLASFYEFGGLEYLGTYREALTMLQNSAPPMDPEASRSVIEEEFQRPLQEVFPEFVDDAVASASIGQVHRARLASGEEVAVKVQYPGVDEAVRSDLKNVTAMTKLAVAIAPNLDPKEVANEVKDRVLEELDYRREATSQAKFANLFRDHPFIVVPKVYPDFCRPRVITQEFLHGRPFTSAFDWSQEDRDQLGEMVYRFFYGSLTRFRVFSADPHPGNYLLLEGGRVAFLDFGLVRTVDANTLELFLELALSVIADDVARGREALFGLGILNQRTPEVDAVWEHVRMLNRPILEDGPFKIDAPLVQEMGAASLDPRSAAFQALRKLGVPGVIVTLNRMGFGVASILARLEATRNWQGIFREFWEGRASTTQLGKEEEDWMAQTHPDFVPPLSQP